ncbi:MAG TPA: PilZ domain-containing protein [Nitrospira sp.]|nr:PilZ domain-containing protein [Nitrospira sp.]
MRPLAAELYEKRWIPRHHMVVPIHCQLFGKYEAGSGWVKDFSSIGASVISNLPLTPGDELTLTLPTEGQPQLRIAATVRWNQGQLLGIEFTQTPRT